MEAQERRARARLRLSLPTRIHCRESLESEWTEMTRLDDLTPFGAGFSLSRPIEPGRLLHMTLPMPRQLRCFDHVEDQYRVWALVRRLTRVERSDASPRFTLGVAFVGKYPPASFISDPAKHYDIKANTTGDGLWDLKEQLTDSAGSMLRRRNETRLRMAVEMTVEVFDERGEVEMRETTVTENISPHGAAVFTSLAVARGRLVRVTGALSHLCVIAAVRGRSKGADGITRLHLEFVDRTWPLEGIE